MDRNSLIIVLLVLSSVIAMVLYQIKRMKNNKKKEEYFLWCSYIGGLLIFLILLYIVLGTYDKMGIRRNPDKMHFYDKSNVEYVIDENYFVNVNDKNDKYLVRAAFIDMSGYLVIINQDNLTVIDENNHVYIDEYGNKYVEAIYALWDFFGHPIIR